MPAQDKDYLVAFAQLPDGATLDRTERVIRQMSALALDASRRRQLGRVSRALDQRLRQRAEHRHRVRDAQAVGRAGAPCRAWTPTASSASSTSGSAAIQDAFVAIFPPPPVQGLGHVGGFKLYVEDRAGLGLRGALPAGAGRGRRRAAGAGARRAVLELPGQRAADRRARRSRAGEDLRHPADRRLRHAAGLSRLALRQRLQPLRPHLPGQRAGGVVVPHAAGADRAAEDAQRARRDGAARLGAARSAAATGPIR